ncbi:MAG TPA: CpaD family pilus assembly lipoprotein [Stellaceae bacterium]|nr:CpaD family pilus assembly lipoprotein [Stellaceae bacterium]
MRALLPSACLLLLTALSACVGTSDPPKPIEENPNRFTYHTDDFTYAVHFASASDKLSPEEVQRLQAFLQQSSARPEDKATVSGEASPIGQTRSTRVREMLTHAGLTAVPGVNVNLAPNTVTIVLTEQVVTEPPKCGDWPQFAGDAPSNAPSLFLGCALRNNLYKQVVDKRDLAVGRTAGPADAEPGMRAVQKYREGKSGKQDKDDSASQSNAGAGSASGTGDAAASMANPPGGGNNNGQ